MHRHPLAVINSQIKAMRALLATRSSYNAMVSAKYNNLWNHPILVAMARWLFSSRLGLGCRLVVQRVAQAADYFLRHVGQLAPEDSLSVRYEYFCQEPGSTLQAILDFLGLAGRRVHVPEGAIQQRAGPWIDFVERHQGAIVRKMARYLAWNGYPGASV
jgi:hypothetical protein